METKIVPKLKVMAGEEVSHLLRVIGPVLKLLELFGVWSNYKVYRCIGKEDDYNLVKRYVIQIIRVAILIIVYANAAKCIVSALTWSEIPSVMSIFNWGVYTVWVWQMCLIVTILFWSSNSKVQFPKLLTYVHLNQEVFQSSNLRKHLRYTNIVMIIFSMLAITNIAIIGTILLSDFKQFDMLRSAMLEPLSDTQLSRIIMVITMAIMMIIWIAPKCLLVVFCHYMSSIFCDFNEALQKIKDRGELGISIAKLRRMHNTLCASIDLADGTFSKLIFLHYVPTMVELCAILYMVRLGILSGWVDLSFILVCGFWASASVFDLYVFSSYPAELNKNIHAPLNILYACDANEYCRYSQREELNLEIYLFISKLSNEPIGLSFWEYFVITKEVILTLIGMFATYFILMIQFNF